MSSSLKYSIAAFLVFHGSLTSATPPASGQPLRPEPPLEILVSQDASNPDSLIQIAKTSVTDAKISDLADVLESLPRDKDVVISTDSIGVAEEVARERSSDPSSRLIRLIPLGPLKAAIDGTKRLAQTVGRAARADKIGLSLVLINTSYDSYVWIHATQFSPEVRAAQILYITLLSLTFSIDKDLWARTSRKIQGKMIRLLDPALITTDGTVTPSKLGYLTNYASHLLMSLIVQSGRVAILAYDAVITAPFLANAAASALALSLLYTFTHYAWSEFSASVDDAKNPVAKFFVRRFAEARSATVGFLAPSGKVLQPDVHGFTPWVTLISSGVAGLIALAHRKTLIPWLEDQTILQWFRTRATHLEEGIGGLLPFRRSTPPAKPLGSMRTCSALFGG